MGQSSPEAKRRYYLANKECLREKARAAYAADPERQRAATRRWAKANPAQQMLSRARRRAKQKGLPFDIELSDVVIPATCPVLRIPITVGLDKRDRGSPSLDRIIPALGYTKGNVQVISTRANAMKQDASPAELLAFADWIRRNF